MAPTDIESTDLRWGIATASLGMHPNQTLEKKFQAVQKAGFSFCEVGMGGYIEWVYSEIPDLPKSTGPEDWCEAGEPDPSDNDIWAALYDKTADLKKLAASYGLTILMLQPLNQFDGWRKGTERHNWARAKAEKWMTLCSKLGVEMIQVGSNDYAEADASDEDTAEDMRWLAEFSSKLEPPVKIAYECWCFSKRLSDWEHSWKIVQLANHSNLGLCLDSGQFPLSPSYGWDPVTGKGWSHEQSQAVIDGLRALPASKIFYVELSDCIRPVVPLGQGSPYDNWRQKTMHPRGDNFMWAASARSVPLVGKDAGTGVKTAADMGGARVIDMLQAILSTGYKGPVMYEFFEAETMEKDDDNIPVMYADACALSKERLVRALKA